MTRSKKRGKGGGDGGKGGGGGGGGGGKVGGGGNGGSGGSGEGKASGRHKETTTDLSAKPADSERMAVGVLPQEKKDSSNAEASVKPAVGGLLGSSGKLVKREVTRDQDADSSPSSLPYRSYAQATRANIPSASGIPHTSNPAPAASFNPSNDQYITSAFSSFLNNFAYVEGKTPFYPELVGLMKNTGLVVMEIKFEDILKTHIQLAFALANNKRRDELLRPILQKLLRDKNIGSADVLYQNVSLKLVGVPTSITPFHVYYKKGKLVKAVKNMFEDNQYIHTVSDLAIALIHGFLKDIYHMHTEEMVAYNGEFEVRDMVIANNSQYRITKKPTVSAEVANVSVLQWRSAKVNDVRKLEKFFTHMIDLRPVDMRVCEPMSEHLPLFYFTFRKALETVTEEEVVTASFWEYILNHPVLKMPHSRHDLVISLCTVMKAPMAESFPIEPECCRIHAILNRETEYDWFEVFHESNIPVLRKTAGYFEGGEERSKGGDVQDVYDNSKVQVTYWASLKLDRNLGQHAGDNANVDIISIPDLEVFGSSKLGDYLSLMLKDLVYARLNKSARFADLWLVYESSHVPTTDGKRAEPGPRLAFW